MKMVLEYYCFGNGIGSVSRAFAKLGINAICLGISEVDVDAIVANHILNGGAIQERCTETTEVIIEYLAPFNLRVDFADLDRDRLSILYNAHIATKNMGDMHSVQSLPTSCDMIICCFNDLSHIAHFKKILSATPNKPRFLMMQTLPDTDCNLDPWMATLSDLGYYSVSRTVRSSDCGVPERRGRRFVVSNKKPFSLHFRTAQTMTPLAHFLKDDSHYEGGQLLPSGNVQVCDADGNSRYLTILDRLLLAGYTTDDYTRVCSYMTDKKLHRLLRSSAPVYMFVEVFNNIFVSPTSIITSVVSVPSNKLDMFKIRSNILDLLKLQFEGKCNKVYGFISSVVEIKDILDAYVSSADSSNMFRVSYMIRSTKPRLNNTYNGEVKACFSTGIITTIGPFEEMGFDCRVLITSNGFDSKTKTVSFSTCKCVFSRRDRIMFQITRLEYSQKDNAYQCIGTHKCS